jgi:hypothetical protein
MTPVRTDWMARLSSGVSSCATRGATTPVLDGEGIAVLAKTDRFQPFPDLAHALSRSSNALASFKSSVSKPSVNQP